MRHSDFPAGPFLPGLPGPRRPLCLGAAALLLTCLLPAAVAAAPLPAGPHVDLVDYPRNNAQWEPFHDLRRRLEKDFDEVCGDTFCEGEFSDIQAFRIRCSVQQASGTVSQCRWAFAASELGVDRDSGRIEARQPVWLCPLPVPPGTSVAAFLGALSGPRPLYRVLPGATETFYEALGDCLR